MAEREPATRLSYADRKVIDEICDKFESEYLSGMNPCVKEYVARLPKRLMQTGLVELVSLDAFYGPSRAEPSSHKNLCQGTIGDIVPDEQLTASDTWQNYVAIFPTLADVPVPPEFQTRLGTGLLIDGRFKSIRKHASGGLGSISIATDVQFNRNVAIKEIQSVYASNRSHQRRFLREAEITGQLEHPGVVPVYVLGRYENDEPFYAMRFIQGQSLYGAINEMHGLQGQTSLVRRRRKLLNRLIDVCNTVEYAHSKGIIHRDIKPQNIMLGEFGETLLVDWGLAKHLSESDDPSAEFEPPESSQSKTRSGTILGTAGYMSPEQANGDIDSVNSLSDIYSLGATMFQLLTGNPPPGFETDSNKHTWATRLYMLLDEVRLPQPIKAICCKAMSLEARERYQSATALAADIEMAMADEPISVYQDPIWTRARRWIQRNPAIATAGLVTIGLTVLGLVTLSALTNAHSMEVQAKNGQLDKLYNQEKELRRVAQESEKRASNALDFMSDSLRSPDPNRKGRDVRVVDQLSAAIHKLDSNYGDDRLLQARVLNEIGFTYYGLSEFKESARLLERARDLYSEDAGENDSRTLIAGKNLGNAWLRLKDERAHQTLSNVFHRAHSSRGPEDPLTLNFQRVLAEAWIEQGNVQSAIDKLESMTPLYRQIHGESSPELMSLNSSLAKAYAAAGQNLEAAKLTKLIHEWRVQRDGELSLSAITAGHNHVKFLGRTNKRDDAVPLLETLLPNARKGLGNDHYQTILLMKELGQTYLASADRARGIPLVEEAWQRITAAYGEEHSLSVSTANSLGFAYMAQGNYEKAAAQFESTYELALRIYGPEHSETLTLANNLAMTFQLSEQYDSAIDIFEKTIASQSKKLGQGHPKTILTMVNFAGALRSSGRYADSVPVCREVVKLAEALEEDHYYSQIAMLVEGTAWLALEDFESARDIITKCHDSRIRTSPNHWQRFHTMSLLGEAMMGLGDHVIAEPLLLESFENLVQLESTIPQRVKIKVKDARLRVARLYEAKNMPEKANEFRE